MEKFLIKPQSDRPIDDSKLLGHGQIVEKLSEFITSDQMITPLSIAIHGDWGSGKTSIMKTLEKKLQGKVISIFFEAWKYEYLDPSIALVHEITSKLGEDPELKEKAKEILVMAINALSEKYLGMEFSGVSKLFERNREAVRNLSTELENTIERALKGKKLVILLDDLDRCDVENTLMLLALMKLFLDIRNCICVAAVDFHRLEQAWFSKYGIKDTKNNEEQGREYLEKIFQIRIGLPKPNDKQIEDYIHTLVNDIPSNHLILISRVAPRNPRGIKRMLNLISYRTFLTRSRAGQIIAFLWTLFEEVLDRQAASRVYQILETKKGFVEEMLNYSDWNAMSPHFSGESITPFYKRLAIENFQILLTYSSTILKNLILEVPKQEIVSDFQILYETSREI